MDLNHHTHVDVLSLWYLSSVLSPSTSTPKAYTPYISVAITSPQGSRFKLYCINLRKQFSSHLLATICRLLSSKVKLWGTFLFNSSIYALFELCFSRCACVCLMSTKSGFCYGISIIPFILALPCPLPHPSTLPFSPCCLESSPCFHVTVLSLSLTLDFFFLFVAAFLAFPFCGCLSSLPAWWHVLPVYA